MNATLLRDEGHGVTYETVPAALDADAVRLAQVAAPSAGTAVLACACGRVLDADDMYWDINSHPAVINRITCRSCAGNRAW